MFGRIDAQASGHARQANLGQGEQWVDQRTHIHLPAGALHAPGIVAAQDGLTNLPGGVAEVFVGRDDALTVLERELQGDQSRVVVGQAIHGMGGVGKTELARQYTFAHADQYQVRWWITAESAEHIQGGLASLAERLHPPLPQQLTLTVALGLEQAAAWAVGWLQAHHKWLLVLDNVEDPRDVQNLLSQLRTGHLLVTTRRNVTWPAGVYPLALNVLSQDAAVDLLARISGCTEPSERTLLAEIAMELGWLPLALEQAAAYMRETQIGPADYLDLLARHPTHLYSAVPEGGDAARTIARLWHAHLEAIRRRDPLAERLLQVLAHYAPDDIPRFLINAATMHAEGDLAMLDALRLLASYHLINLDRHTIAVHRLLQAVLVMSDNPMPADTANGMMPAQVALAWLAVAWPITSDQPNADEISRRRLLSPHIAALTRHHQVATSQSEIDWVFSAAAQHEFEQGNYERAHVLARHSYLLNLSALGEDHLTTLISRRNLALMLCNLGRPQEAEIELRAVLQTMIRMLGEEHPATLSTRSILLITFRDLGRLNEAEAESREIWQCRARVLGEEDPDTLASHGDFALVLTDLGRLEDAEAEFRVVWRKMVHVLGDKHPSTLNCHSNLASLLRDLGRFTEAEVESRAVWQLRAQVLGKEHPRTIASHGNLALVLGDLGRLEEAEAELRLVWRNMARVLGDDHPEALDCRGNLAIHLSRLERHEEAVADLREILQIRLRVQGEEHPSTLIDRSNLALLLQELGRLEEAETELLAIWQTRVKVLGKEHPDTLTSHSNFAHVLLALGRLEDAEAELRTFLPSMVRVLGEDHPSTRANRGILDFVTHERGKEADEHALTDSDDASFSDSDVDESVPVPAEHIESLLRVVAEDIDDPRLRAFVLAGAELGYMVTETNKHLFTALEVEEFSESVTRYLSEQLQQGGLAGFAESQVQQIVGMIATGSVGADLPRTFVEKLITEGSNASEEEAGLLISIVLAASLGLLVSAKDAGIGEDDLNVAVQWVADNLGGIDYAGPAAVVAMAVWGGEGIEEHLGTSQPTVEDMHNLLGQDFAPAMMWLCAGLLATAGDGDISWLYAISHSEGRDA